MTVSLVARRHGVAPNQLFTWRRLVAQGALTAAGRRGGAGVGLPSPCRARCASCYVAGETRSFARDIGLEPRTTPIESPQSNGMAEAFVRTIKRDYVHVSPRRMHRPSCTSYHLGLITTTRFTPTRHSDIVHPVSSSQLTEARDRVRSFGGYNKKIADEKRMRSASPSTRSRHARTAHDDWTKCRSRSRVPADVLVGTGSGTLRGPGRLRRWIGGPVPLLRRALSSWPAFPRRLPPAAVFSRLHFSTKARSFWVLSRDDRCPKTS